MQDARARWRPLSEHVGNRSDDGRRAVAAHRPAADPRVTESIKWKTPTFAYKGNIASFNPSKNVVSIMFHRGAEIPGDHPRLEGDGRLVRTMRFASLEEIEAGRAHLEAAVRAWCDWKG